eukprot:TRINITY_DN121560_c0_g1_i1.p1 TRINITY_DN121560_c0_g1~~TRINITY_DN121560_c0_g1_i1.p1  ORF type:complete len:683 (-),score=137.68 TRINITY_DN121560_c0_g1_i1:14-2062(-)
MSTVLSRTPGSPRRLKQLEVLRAVVSIVSIVFGGSLFSLWLRSDVEQKRWFRELCITALKYALGAIRGKIPGWRQPFVKQQRRHPSNKEVYSIWWPSNAAKTPASTGHKQRLWVLLPGGMGDGYDFYLQEFAECGILHPEFDDWCVFHNPGLGGAKYETTWGCGLSDPTYLLDFLSVARHGDESTPAYEELVVVGFSVGGMLSLQAAQRVLHAEEDPVADGLKTCCRFVAVHCPDRVRTCFEQFSSWKARLDVPLALKFWFESKRGGLLARCPPAPKLPWPPTWQYMRRCTEAIMNHGQAMQNGGSPSKFQKFEEFEDDHFCGIPSKAMPGGRVLRIVNPHDPIVTFKSLDSQALQLCEVWWNTSGGHCGVFGADSNVVEHLRSWARREAMHAEVVEAFHRKSPEQALLARQAPFYSLFFDVDIWGPTGDGFDPDILAVDELIRADEEHVFFRSLAAAVCELFPENTRQGTEMIVYHASGFDQSKQRLKASFHVVFPDLLVERPVKCWAACPPGPLKARPASHLLVRDHVTHRFVSDEAGRLEALQEDLRRGCGFDVTANSPTVCMNDWCEVFDEVPLWHEPWPGAETGLRLAFTDKPAEGRPKLPYARWQCVPTGSGGELFGRVRLEPLPDLTEEEWVALSDIAVSCTRNSTTFAATPLDYRLLHPDVDTEWHDCPCPECR